MTNHEELHEYAARQTVEALKRGANHDAMVGLASAVVGAALDIPCSVRQLCPPPPETRFCAYRFR